MSNLIHSALAENKRRLLTETDRVPGGNAEAEYVTIKYLTDIRLAKRTI